MDVLILAAGLGSRVSKYTLNTIPKFLINIDDNTGLYYILQYWKKYADNIYLVIHSNFYEITQFYIDNVIPSEYNYKIKLITYDESDGTAFTLNYILNNQLHNKIINKNLLITWCDLYPIDDIDFSLLNSTENNNIHVFTNGNKCRYGLKDNNVVFCEKSDGNILGIFYIQNYTGFNLNDITKGDDIVLYLHKIGQINELKVNNIIDYGDEQKLQFIVNNSNILKINGRYFNKFTIFNNKLLKEGITLKGVELIQKEREWYSFINNNKIHPTLYEDINLDHKNSILIEYKKNYIPVYQYFININKKIKDNSNLEDTFNEIKPIVLECIIKKIKYLHSLNVQKIDHLLFFKNLEIEIFDKIIQRKKNIEEFINYFGKISIVNGINISSFEEILDKCKKIIFEYYEKIDKLEYRTIHGDCQFSNILLNNSNITDICLIDPRGYFGESMIFGPVEYDYAKILYGISGYDAFNANYFIIDSIDNQSINFEIPQIKFKQKVLNKYFYKIHYAYLVVIWLGLADYNKNNIWKCLASYYHGLYLGTLL
jgi:hypothetical protein